MSANTKVYFEQGGATLQVASGGTINLASGAALTANGNALMNAVTGLNAGVAAAGLKIVGGEVTLDGSNPTPVTTGLTTIYAAFAIQKVAVTPGDDPSAFTVDYTGGALSIYAWKNTGGTDPTLVASTNNAAVICWIAIGV